MAEEKTEAPTVALESAAKSEPAKSEPVVENQKAATQEPKEEPAPLIIPEKKPSEGTKDWKDIFADQSLRSSKQLAKFKTADALAKSYVELESKLGQKNEPPKDGAGPEEWERFYTSKGRPQSPAEYKFDAIDGFDVPDVYYDSLKKYFYDIGLDSRQANKMNRLLAENYLNSVKMQNESNAQNKQKAEQEHKAALEEAESTLHQAWGLNYDVRLNQARRFLTDNGGDDVIQHLEDIGVASDPVLLQLFAVAGAATGSHRFITGENPKGKNNPGDRYAYMNADRQ